MVHGAEVANGATDDGGAVSGEEGPRAVPVHGDVELAAVVVHAEGSAMEADHVTEAEDDGEVLEAVGVHDDGGVVAALGAGVDARVNDLERAAVELLVDLVGEGGVNDNTVAVVELRGGEAGLAELDVVVLEAALGLTGLGLGRGLGLLGRSGSWQSYLVFLVVEI